MHSLRQRINRRDESGFMLIELLVVLIIIRILLAIAVPSYLGLRDKAQKTSAAADVREAILSVEAFFSDQLPANTYTGMTVARFGTRQLRLVGLLVGVVVLAAGYLVVTKHKTNTPSTASSTPAVTTPTHKTPTPSKAHTHATTPVKLVTHGLPVKIALALRKHSVVV